MDTALGTMADPRLNLDEIQGNIIGFNKPFQSFLFLRFDPGLLEEQHRWLGTFANGVTSEQDGVTSGQDVVNFRNAHRKHRADPTTTEAPAKVPWRNLAFTHAGLKALGADPLDGFPPEFVAGMAGRAGILGDVGSSAPTTWVFNKENKDGRDDGQKVHAVMILAADSPGDLEAEEKRQRLRFEGKGITVLHPQQGEDRAEVLGDKARGTEHFGFKDGVSQPGIDDDRVTPNPQAGQTLTPPGEFVLGYPRQKPKDEGGAETAEAPMAEPNPPWTLNGSYLVFRRLRQNVRAFQDLAAKKTSTLGLDKDLFMAKLVGRYPSGAPLAALNQHVTGANKLPRPISKVDPGEQHPILLDDDHVNDFGYQGDDEGKLVPRGAHIRRLNPRDQPAAGRSSADTRRILRHGIPFGKPYRPENTEPADGPEFPADRGLLFICYQSSIANQYEFLQESWANDPYFPRHTGNNIWSGQDPLIGKGEGDRTFHIPGTKADHAMLKQWVTMTGGDYFFSPSKKALKDLATGLPMPPVARQQPDAPAPQAGARSVATAEQPGDSQPIVSPAPPAAERKVYTPTGAGACKLEITVAFSGLDPTLYYPWRVWVKGEPVWQSAQESDYLVPNSAGFATGTVWLRLLRLLEAFDPNRTAGKIVQGLWRDQDPAEVLGGYATWQVELITRKSTGDGKMAARPRNDSSGMPLAFNEAPATNTASSTSPEPTWTTERIGEFFPIDMTITPP